MPVNIYNNMAPTKARVVGSIPDILSTMALAKINSAKLIRENTPTCTSL